MKRILDLKIGWFISNLALLVPVLIPLFLGRGLPIFMPGFLLYCYALLAVGYYLFDQHLSITTQKISYTNTIKALSILAVIGIVIFYAAYDPVDASISTFILSVVSPIIFLIAFVLAYYLNAPLLKRQGIEEEQKEREMEALVKMRQDTRDSARRNAIAIVEEDSSEDKQN